MPKLALLVLALVASLVTPAIADDWIAQKLRGVVLELVDGDWQKVERGDAVPETRVVRTLGNARVLFQNGSQTVELGPDTQVQFFRRPSDGFITVKQYFGDVTVEADIEKVKHFAVQAPQLVAVVKGTIFTVHSDGDGASVEVKRGAVGVISTADHSSVTVKAGQEASTSDTGALLVSGVPKTVDAKGKVKTTLTVAATDDSAKSNGKGSDHGNSGDSGQDHSGNGNSGSGNDDGDNSNSDNSGHGNSDSSSDNSGHGDDDQGEDED
jgi:hypothetical protein